MTHSQTSHAKSILAALIIGLSFSARAFAQATCSHKLVNQTQALEGESLDPETQNLLSKIEAVAGGSLTSHEFTSINSADGTGGYTKFKFANDSDDGTLIMHVSSMDDASLTKLAEAMRVQAINLGFIQVDAPLNETKQFIAGLMADDTFIFNAAICLSPSEKDFSIQLTGVPAFSTEGATGLVTVKSEGNGQLFTHSAFSAGAGAPSTEFDNTVVRGTALEATGSEF